VTREEKQTLPTESVRAFFAALPSDSWRAVVTVLFLTGMRQGELLGLRWMDIDFLSKQIIKRNVVYRGQLVEGLKQTKRTGEVKKYVISMCPIVENILVNIKTYSQFANSECFVFRREDGRPLDPDHIRRYVLYPAMEIAGIPMVVPFERAAYVPAHGRQRACEAQRVESGSGSGRSCQHCHYSEHLHTR